MFAYCSLLTSLDLSNFNSPNVISMYEMFTNCKSLSFLNINNFNSSKVTTMGYMFNNCSLLTSLNLTNFDTSNVGNMAYIFHNCSSLTSLDLSNFITSNVTQMQFMFYGCSKLNSLNLNNFDTSQVAVMSRMFANCLLLESLDISNFDTSQVTRMYEMFVNCKSLRSLNLTSFKTSKVNTLAYMFTNCSLLRSLNLSTFDISEVTSMYGMFSGCSNLEYINLMNFNSKSNINTAKMFEGILDNIFVCLFDSNIIKRLNDLNCYIIDCSDDWNLKRNKLINKDNTCNDNCILCDKCNNNKGYYSTENFISNIENYINCYNKTPEGYFFDIDNSIYKKCYNSCELCTIKGNLTNHNCLKCNSNYPLKILIGEYYNCYENCTYYHYFDENNNYHCTYNYSCPDNYKNFIPEKNECINKCCNDDKYKYEYNNICYKEYQLNPSNIINYTYNNIYQTKLTSFIFSQITSNIILSNIVFEEKIIGKKNLTIIHNLEGNNSYIYNKIITEYMNQYMQNNDNIIIEKGDKSIYQISPIINDINDIPNLLNQSINNPYRLSIIFLGKCGDILKERYNISKDQELICVQHEILTDIISERNLKYEIYDPTGTKKLNLSFCDENGTSINVYTPINYDEETKKKFELLEKQGYDLFNKNDPFYNDICTVFKSENGTDVILKDRINEFYKPISNNTQCQNNCKFNGFMPNFGYINCECNDNANTDIESDVKFDKKMIYESFYDSLKNSNYGVIKCYNLVFNKTILLHNIGNFIVIIYFFIYINFILYFIFTGINSLKIKATKIILVNHKNIRKELDNNINLNNNILLINKKSEKKIIRKGVKKINKKSFVPPKRKIIKIYNAKNINNNILLGKNSLINKIKNPNIINSNEKRTNSSLLALEFNKNKNFLDDANHDKIINRSIKNIKNHNFKLVKPSKLINEKKLDNYELNNLEYSEAINFDHRNFFEIYWSKLNREHIIFFTFCSRNDYNLIVIKLTRFIFLLCTDMAMNVFFFSDDSMHKIYKSYGKYNFLQQLPQMIYSFAASQLLEVILCFLSLTDKHIYQIKELKRGKRDYANLFKILRCIKIKLVLFYLFTFIFFIFYWYLITAFCAVYQNTQIIFIKDSITSFSIGLLYPFVLYLFPAFFRILALLDRVKKRTKIIYFISEILPIF